MNEVDDFSLLVKSIVESNTVDDKEGRLRAALYRSGVEVTEFHFEELRTLFNTQSIPWRISLLGRCVETEPRKDVTVLPDKGAGAEVEQWNDVGYEFRCVFML